jgi:hypothetical protein
MAQNKQLAIARVAIRELEVDRLHVREVLAPQAAA